MTGEHLAPDLQEFVRLLHVYGVRYLIVGGEAVIHHGYPRLTGDVDFFYERTPANVRRLYAALEEFWNGPVPAIAAAEELLEPDLIVQFGRPPNRIDLIGSLGSVRFAGAWRRRVEERLEIEGEEALPFPIIGLSDLLKAKRDAGRPKDLDDIDHLRALHRARPRRR